MAHAITNNSVYLRSKCYKDFLPSLNHLECSTEIAVLPCKNQLVNTPFYLRATCTMHT